MRKHNLGSMQQWLCAKFTLNLLPVNIEKRWNHLNAVTVGVEKMCKLLNKVFGHQCIAQLGHLVLSSWTLFRPFLIFDIKYLVWMWNDFYFGNVAQQAHQVPQKVAFVGETLFALEIMLRLESSLIIFKGEKFTLRKRHMPPPSRNLFEFSGVSSVRFHKVNQVISIIVSQVPS